MIGVSLPSELKSVSFRGDEDAEPVVCKIFGEISDETVTEVQNSVTNAMFLHQKILPVYINSGGGCPYNALSIISWLDYFPGTVVTIVNGRAFSCAAIIFCCGNIRYVSSFSTLMFHRIRIEDLTGEHQSVKVESDELRRLDEKLFREVEIASKMENGKFFQLIKERGTDWYIDYKEAMNMSLADHVGNPQFTLNIKTSWTIKDKKRTLEIKSPNKKRSKR